MYIEFVVCALASISLLLLFKLFDFASGKGNGGPRLKMVPGPRTFPLLGSVPSILYNIRHITSKSSFELLEEFKKKWGSPMSVKIGSVNAVIIDDLSTARKLMLSEDWANRLDDNPIWYTRSFDKHYGLLISNGESWKEMRKFVHKTLTRHGFGRTRALEMIHEIEILNFFDHLNKLRAKSDNVVEMQGLFNVSAFNILWRLVAGSRFAYNNEEIIRMMKVLQEFAHGVHPRELVFFVFPWLKHFPSLSGYQRFIDNHEQLQNYFLRIMNERRKSGEFRSKQDTFLDIFLDEIEHHKVENINPNYYTDEQLAMVLLDLFLTGFIPTASCVEFLIMFMILHPEIQRKCHEEIDTVIGRKRYPSINDNDKMPYTYAVCLEVLRHVTFIPLTTRSATKDTTIDDYFIPKGTIVAINLYGIHHDKKTWKTPHEFKPERFLDDDGKLCNQDLILPFGSGKRVCPAEVYARVSTFTYFTYLLQKYTFECPPSCAGPDPTPNVGLGNYAKPFRCVIRDRQMLSSELIANSYYENDDSSTLV